MRSLRLLTHLTILATTPSLLAYPKNPFGSNTAQVQTVQSKKLRKNFRKPDRYHLLTYDEILELFREIESGEAEQKYRLKDLIRMNNYLAYLAETGTLPNSENAREVQEDIAVLLNDDFADDEFYFAVGDDEYAIVPAIYSGQADFAFCKNGWSKSWKKTRKFFKKHKKEIIIGLIIVAIAVTITIAVVTTTPAGASAIGTGVLGATGSAISSNSEKPPHFAERIRSLGEENAPIILQEMESHIPEIQQTFASEQFFTPASSSFTERLSLEETGRVIGPLYAHETLRSTHPPDTEYGHRVIDHYFSTDYAPLFSKPEKTPDFHIFSYQMRGEKALEFGHYDQAVSDLGKAVDLNPTDPIPYLHRSTSYFHLGQYDRALKDFDTYAMQAIQSPEVHSLSIPEFSLGFAKGLPKGVYESGESLLIFLADFVQPPVHTTTQVIDAFSTLAGFVRNDEWGLIGEALAPEIFELITQWHTIPSDKRGELAGYAFGKYGADILVPGAIAKVAAKSARSAKELATVCKNIRVAQETLLLEAAAGVGNGAKVGEIVIASRKTTFLGEELGISAKEMGQLKQAGQLEVTLQNKLSHLSLPMKESIKLFEEAEKKLQHCRGIFMPESQIRELIHATGIPTFPRPAGVPKNFRIKVSNRGAGMIYFHPEHTHTSIRVMPGKPHSPFPQQRKPYVIYRKNGQTLDKFGNVVDAASLEAHIPIKEFVFKD